MRSVAAGSGLLGQNSFHGCEDEEGGSYTGQSFENGFREVL